MYISDWDSQRVKRINRMDTSQVRPITAELMASPMDLKVLHKMAQPKGLSMLSIEDI